jgi:hypothetical protein
MITLRIEVRLTVGQLVVLGHLIVPLIRLLLG